MVSGQIIVDVPGVLNFEVQIINKNTKQITYPNLYGDFSIRAQQNDTLLFSSITLEKRNLILTKDLLQKKEFIVHLNADYVILDTVTVYGNRLDGDLKRDVDPCFG
ncbi:MAG: hypothetical protein ACMUEM_03710 [Flavobacteriales bacterium AspAUS03]